MINKKRKLLKSEGTDNGINAIRFKGIMTINGSIFIGKGAQKVNMFKKNLKYLNEKCAQISKESIYLSEQKGILNNFEMKFSKNGGIYNGINATCFKRNMTINGKGVQKVYMKYVYENFKNLNVKCEYISKDCIYLSDQKNEY
jgi:hypothetical protein